MRISETRNDGIIQLDIDGRVETTTAPLLQQAILNGFQKGNNIILNFSNVSYISSAGLRALLIGQKTANSKKGSMKLINVRPAVMGILEQTGFAKLLVIS